MTSNAGLFTGPTAQLPSWTSVLAVVAHPDDESFGLGAILDTFAQSGTAVHVLSFTHGEASTVQGGSENLAAVRAAELQDAATTLGVASAVLRNYPDGGLSRIPSSILAADVVEAVGDSGAQGMVVFDSSGVTGHADHTAASLAALEAAATEDLPVLGWTLPATVAQQLNNEYDADFFGHEAADIDVVISVDRERQHIASLAHVSQAIPSSVLWRRLELLEDNEYLRWLRSPAQ